MLKNISRVIIHIMLLMALTGCSILNIDGMNRDRIDRPSNKMVPVAGTWRIIECIRSEESDASVAKDPLAGDSISLSEDAVVYSDKYFDNISYKIKRVNVHEYFLHKNAAIPEKSGIKGNEAFVITVCSEDNYLMEFIRDSSGIIIAAIDDKFYSLKKVSDEFPGTQGISDERTYREEYLEVKASSQTLRSGLLLGVRIPVRTEDGLGDYRYGTYWISAINNVDRPVYYAEGIYLPRMDGFWKVKVEKRLGEEGTEDNLVASKVSVSGADKKLDALLFRNTTDRIETRQRTAIIYIGNDYVCVENTVYDNKGEEAVKNPKKVLRTLPIDNLDFIDGITISDLAGENGSIAMKSAISDLLESSGQNMFITSDERSQEKNFALYRKTGHWFFKGRVNLDQYSQLPYMDFNLNLIPPANMVAYDILHVPWTEMKDKIPHAVDIYTSPNQDIAVVLTQDEILVNAIENRKLADEPLARYPLQEGSSVIMAEWSLADYVPSWEKSFIKNNEAVAVENIMAE